MYPLSDSKIQKLVSAVQGSLSDDLRKPQYRGHENCLAGHCYVASEALYHLLGGARSGWVPQNIQHEGGPHWYLKHKVSGAVLDPTASQFKTKVPYENGRGKGFLTKQPSKRTQTVLDRLKNGGIDLPIAKSSPTPVFPKLGVPDDRRETMPVNTQQALTMKLRQFANNAHVASGNKGPVDAHAISEYIKGKSKSVGSSTSNGPTINSYALGTSLRPNATPRIVAGVMQHEDTHNVFRRVQLKHGMQARQQLASGLLSRLRSVYPQFHAAVHDFIKVRNGEDYKPALHDEEVIAHTVNFLNNQHERIRYHSKKGHDAHTAQAFDSVMKRGYKTMRQIANQADPTWLGKMAISSIKPGTLNADGTFDYSHILKPEHVEADYGLHVVKPPKGNGVPDNEYRAVLTQKFLNFKDEIGMVVGHLDPDRKLNLTHSSLVDDHQGQGLGTAMYEALLAHAKHHLGVHTVQGDTHSSMASRVHSSLANKHGLNYVPVKNVTPDKEQAGAFDGHFGPYSYALKSELAKASYQPSAPSLPDMPTHHCQAFVQSDGVIRQCKKPVKASGLCYLHLAKIGHFFESENDKQKKIEVSSIAVFNSEGYLLMGIRTDSNKWTLPGGKAEDGESPEKCAHRELWEEAGIKIKKLEYQGSGWGGKNGDVKVSVFRGESNDSPTGENDPDKEVDEWEWIDVREGLPKEVRENLHNGKHDINLQILGLLEGESDVELSKSWKHAFVGAMTAASLSASPALAQDTVADQHKQDWTPAGLSEELKPIAHLESEFGQKMTHKPHSKGEYYSAFGAVGLKAVTAHDEYKRTKYLQQIYPDLHDQERFMSTFKTDPYFYNAVATAHWNRLKKIFGGDVHKAAFAWRWGQGKAARTDPETITASPYVQGYDRIWNSLRGQQVAQVLVNPLEKKAQEWIAKSLDRPATQRVVLYDFDEDPFEHMTPTARHTEDGTFYEPVEMATVVEKLKRMGYHGYHHGGQRILFPEFEHLASTIQ